MPLKPYQHYVAENTPFKMLEFAQKTAEAHAF